MPPVNDPSSAPGHRSAGLLLLVLLAGCAALVIAGHGPSATPGETRTAAAWPLGSWVHSVSAPTIGRDAAAGLGLEPLAAGGDSAEHLGRQHREHAFGFAIASRTLSRRVNLPPPSC